jgi:hypothetical protein
MRPQPQDTPKVGEMLLGVLVFVGICVVPLWILLAILEALK